MSKKVMKKALALVLALTMVFSTVVVSGAAKKNKVTINGTSVAVTSKVTLKKGKKLVIKTTASKCKVANSKKSVATAKVSKKKITIKAKKVGTTKLTITKKGYKKVVVTVKVTKKAPVSVKPAKTKYTVTPGNSKTFKVTTKAKKIKAVSSKTSVATVKVSKKKVTVKAKKAGKATIYVSVKANAAAYKKVTITVKAADVKPVVSAEASGNATVTKDAAGNTVFTLPCAIAAVNQVSATYGTKKVVVSGDAVAEMAKSIAAGTVEKDLAAKAVANAKFDLGTVNGVKASATVTKAYNATTKSAEFKTNDGKVVTVAVASATSVKINGATVTVDNAKNTVTVAGSKKADAVKDLAIGYLK